MLTRHERFWAIPLFLIVLAILLLAAGLPKLELKAGHAVVVATPDLPEGPGEGATLPPDERFLLPYGLILAILLIIILLLTALSIFIPEMRKQLRTYLMLFSFIFVLLFLRNYLRGFGLGVLNEMTNPNTPLSGGEPTIAPPDFILNPPDWLLVLLGLMCVAPLLAMVWYARRLSHHAPTALEGLATEAREAIEDLRAGADLRDTITRCYHDMNLALMRNRGIRRPKAMTAREFEHELERLGMAAESVRRLTRLFERVRYGAHVSSKRDEMEAIDCLTAVVHASEKRAT